MRFKTILSAILTAAVLALTTGLSESRSEDAEARGICPAGLCATQDEITHHDRLVADAKSHRTYAIIGLAGGGAAVAAGAILFLTAARAPADADTHVALWSDGRFLERNLHLVGLAHLGGDEIANGKLRCAQAIEQ